MVNVHKRACCVRQSHRVQRHRIAGNEPIDVPVRLYCKLKSRVWPCSRRVVDSVATHGRPGGVFHLCQPLWTNEFCLYVFYLFDSYLTISISAISTSTISISINSLSTISISNLYLYYLSLPSLSLLYEISRSFLTQFSPTSNLRHTSYLDRSDSSQVTVK